MILSFFDLEDQGEGGTGDVLSWCIGSQYWSKNPHIKNYNAEYGVLLDMVGGPGAIFTRKVTLLNLLMTLWKNIGIKQ